MDMFFLGHKCLSLQKNSMILKERCLKSYSKLHYSIPLKRNGESWHSYQLLAVLQTFYPSGELGIVKMTFAGRFYQNTFLKSTLCVQN